MKQLTILFLLICSVCYSQEQTIVISPVTTSSYPGSTIQIERASIIPNAPTALLDTVWTDVRIDLYWTDNSSNEDGFIIQRSPDDITYTAVDSVSEDIVTYSNTGLTANTAYYYKVLAYKGSSNSDPTEIVGDITYHKEIGRYISGLVTALSFVQKEALNEFVDDLTVGLSIDSLAQMFDIMYVLGGETSESSLRNLVKRTNDATLSATEPSFIAFQGYTGNASSAYITTNYNPNTQGVKYLLNDASFGIYCRTDNINAKVLGGSLESGSPNKRLEITPRYLDAVSYWGINDACNTYAIDAVNSQAFFVLSRTASNSSVFYRNGVAVSSLTTASNAVPNLDIYLLNRSGNASYSNRQISMAFAGKGLTQTQVGIITAAFEEYMDSNETGIIANAKNLIYREDDDLWIACKYNSEEDLIMRFGRTYLNKLIRNVNVYINENPVPFISEDVETIGDKIGGSDDDISPLRRENMGWLSGNHGLDEDTISYTDLTANYTIGQTTMSLTSTADFPDKYGVGKHKTLGWFNYTGKTGNDLTGVSCPVNINSGDSVIVYPATSYTTEFEYSLDGDTVLSNTVYYGDSVYITTRSTVYDMTTYDMATGLADTLYYEDVNFTIKQGTVKVEANLIPLKTFNTTAYYGLTAAANIYFDTAYYASSNPENIFALPSDEGSGDYDLYPCYRNVLSNAELTINQGLYVENTGLSLNRALNVGGDMWIRYTEKSYNVFVGNTSKTLSVENNYEWKGLYSWFDNQYLVNDEFLYAYPVYYNGSVYFFVDTTNAASDYIDISDFAYDDYDIIENHGITFEAVRNQLIPISSASQGYAMIKLVN